MPAIQSPSLNDAWSPQGSEYVKRLDNTAPPEHVDRAPLSPKQEIANKFLGQPGRHKALYGGARSGKTFLFTRAVCQRALKAPGSRHAILRLRANAVRAAIALDTLPKVMRTCFPGARIEEHRMDGYFEFPEVESQIWVGGLDDKERVEKILGQEYATIFLNECSQIPYSSVLVARTRLAQVVKMQNGVDLPQRMYYDLNPPGKGHWSNQEFRLKKSPVNRQPLPDPENYDSMQVNPRDNPFLSEEFLRSLENLPERQRKRFYEGEYIDEVDGALWTYERLDAVRIELPALPPLRRIVVAVDPSGARGVEDERSDEIGICVAGKGYDGRAYVLEDLTCRLGPAGWSRRAVEAYHRWGADAIVAEMNFGRAMVEETIRAVEPGIPIRQVTASRGKAVRAEPVASLYDERVDLVRHVGRLPDLEDQLCSFSVSGYTGERSPDRADAMIWALSDLMVGAGAPQLLFG